MDELQLAQELFECLRALHRAAPQRRIDKSLQGEALVLWYLSASGGEGMSGELVREMRVSSARVAQALGSMKKKGLITRRVDQNDRRRVIVTLTPEGEMAAQERRVRALETIAKMLHMLGEQDAREYVRITRRLEQIVPECGAFL